MGLGHELGSKVTWRSRWGLGLGVQGGGGVGMWLGSGWTKAGSRVLGGGDSGILGSRGRGAKLRSEFGGQDGLGWVKWWLRVGEFG